MKPELHKLEEKVKKQMLLLEKLKDKSGAFKERFDYEQRFARQTAASSVDQQSQVMDDPSSSTSATLPPMSDRGITSGNQPGG